MKITKIIRKKRAVSPILAAILLIGLAVAAGAIMFVVILPMIAGPGLQISIDQTTFAFTDTDSNKIYEKVKVPIKNTGGVDVSVTAIKVQTSSDGGTTWNDAIRTTGLAVPIDVVSGAGIVPEFTFVPKHNDFLAAGDVDYRVVVNYKAEGDDTTSTLESTAVTKEQDGLTQTMADIDASYYYQYTLGTATIGPYTGEAYVVTVSITNNWDCDLVLNKSHASYDSTSWQNGLYVSTDSSYAVGTTSNEYLIYGLCVPSNNFGEAFCANVNNYDTFWTTTLGQTGDPTSMDSTNGRTITPGETVLFHYFGYTNARSCDDGTLYYFSVNFYNIDFRWSETVTLTTGSYS
jgi:FlaG/FlaF family flagellin (archaellin)